MARTPSAFKQTDIMRAVKAARAVGLDVMRTEIAPDGRIIIVHKSDSAAEPQNDLDRWKARRDARSA